MNNGSFEFFPSMGPEDPGGDGSGEPDETSVDDVTQRSLEENDRLLDEAGKLPSGHEPHALSEEEIRARIRSKANDLQKKSLELPEKDQQKIRNLLTTLRIKGSDTASDQEIEIIWNRLLKNPSLVQDFVLLLIDKKTTNNYSEYPLLPDIKDVIEIADDLSNPETVRPRIIQDGMRNLERMGLNRGRCMELAMGVAGETEAEAMRLLGWLAGMPFMRGAYNELRQHSEDMGLEEVSIYSLANTFMVIVTKHLEMLKERAEKNYKTIYKMDFEAREYMHDEVVEAMKGILDLLYKTFLDP